MLQPEFYITIIVDPGTQYEQEIYYDSNHGKNYTFNEALTRVKQLNQRQRDVQDFFKRSVQFSPKQVGSPAAFRANPARIPLPMVDWSRMRPVPPPPPVQQSLGPDDLEDLDDSPFEGQLIDPQILREIEQMENEDRSWVDNLTAEDLENITLIDPFRKNNDDQEDDDSPI